MRELRPRAGVFFFQPAFTVMGFDGISPSGILILLLVLIGLPAFIAALARWARRPYKDRD